MDAAECYPTVRVRMIELAEGLTEEQRRTPVPALPEWTVQDTYAHLAGVCADVLDGTLTGRATDDDTAREVAQRKGSSLSAICEEWAGLAARIDEVMSGQYWYRYGLMIQDVWNHEQDVRGALGLPQAREDATTVRVADLIVGLFERGWRKAEYGPAVRLKTESGEWVIGVGETTAVLETSDFELSRMLIGRRTFGQMRALNWTGDPSPVLERLHVFGPPTADLVE